MDMSRSIIHRLAYARAARRLGMRHITSVQALERHWVRLQRRSRLERGSIHLQILLPNDWACPKVHAIGSLGDEPDPFRISQIIDALTDITKEQGAGSVAILTTLTDRGLPGERESAWCRALWNQLRDAPFRSWPLFHATADGSVGLVPLDQLLSGELAEGY